MNQFATPGLGSLMGGRIAPGIGQLLLALAGFGLVLVWFILTLKEAYNVMNSEAPAKPYGWIGLAGAAVFAASWCWSLATSISLVAEAKAAEAAGAATGVPPRITDPPPDSKRRTGAD